MVLAEPIAVALQIGEVQPLVSALESDFYIDADMIRDALRRRRAFNVIHLATMTKVDVFPLKHDKLSRGEMDRRQLHTVDEESGQTLPLASPEDIILQKLDWHRKSGGSERQWRDVLGVLKIRGAGLDRDYLEAQAEEAGLSELLQEVTATAGEG
jgi:hypothetical protein